ncbi:energy transducer TonB [Nibricoccus aquaticus]|uniref:Energy transducer TonB n=1 Tax=Nibricoccus aquaticus TaxID=2576891 RepID=A0A290Q240_9BACT|nr:energy transducer TonB [Nibricoccus aquaticus]ATC62715.1 energy transducer TonB [Nibricoccus aquaticus]
MRRDLIIGIIVSVALHGLFGYGGELMKPKPKKAVVKEETPAIEVLVPPPVEPEEEEVVDATEQTNDEVASLAPPSITDVPSVVQLNDFTQAVQPPPPPNLGRPTGVMNIPAGRPGTGIGTKIGDIFSLKDLDQQPQIRGVQARPNYPFEMRRAGLNGEVVLRYVVDTNGDVRDVEVVRSSQREFESAAQQAVLKWKYKAGRKGGKAVAVRMQIPIVFNLNDE